MAELAESVMERALREALDTVEGMAQQHCHTEPKDHPRDPLMTDSGALSANADALILLDKYGRFRITKGFGRMVCGYWPEHDPERDTPSVEGGRDG